MKRSNAFNHLTLEERHIIHAGIINGSTKTAIAKTLGKDKSTICAGQTAFMPRKPLDNERRHGKL